ncbi:nucleoporin FG repeat region domain-containing protein [Trichoderma evansii]
MATTGGLFGAKPAATGLFGAATTASPQTTTGGGLFGAAPSTPAANTTAGGLFGSTATAQPAQASGTTGGGLFGSKPAATTTTGTGGGLFGNTATPQQQTTTGGGLFGSTPAAQPSATTGGGLFGSKPAATTTGTGGGLFGGAATTQQSGGGLFSSGTAPAATTTGGGFFGGSTAQPAQSTNQVAAVQVNYDNLRPRSRFDDLAQPVQNQIALIDKGIQRVIKMRDEIGEFMPQHEKDIDQLGRDVQFVESKFKTVQDALNRDIQTVKALQDMTKKNVTDAQLSFKAADNLKLPTHYHQTGLFAGPPPTSDSNSADASSAHASAQDLITYFNRICDDVEKYKKRLDEYRAQIERDMPGVENGLYEQIRSLRDHSNVPVQDQLSQVLAALREMGSAIVAQAGQIADTRERLSRLQAGFLDNGL